MTKVNCRIDNTKLIELFSLGDLYFSDFVDNATDGFKAPLRFGICPHCSLTQLMEGLDPEKMFRRYWYRSGVNGQMVLNLQDIARSVDKYIDLEKGDVILDIGANDGSLLNEFSPTYLRIGFDPAWNLAPIPGSVDRFCHDFFTADFYATQASTPAKVIFCVAMFYDLPNPKKFITDVKKCLQKDGLLVIQLSYTPLMLKQNAFDNIVHEHLEYYTLRTLNNLLLQAGLEIIDCELNNVNSGSLRVYVTHSWTKTKLLWHEKMIGQMRVASLLSYEQDNQYTSVEPYIKMMDRVNAQRTKTLEFLNRPDVKGRVCGYGASTKGNTLLQYYGITPDLISHIADRDPRKWGKKTVGTGIKVISEESMRWMKPDYLFILPWHFTQVFKQREQELRNQGTKFIVPLPYLSIE